MRWLVVVLCLLSLLSAPAFAWLPHGGGIPSSGGGALAEIGSGVTLVNNGNTASNVPVRFGYGYARGDMPLGNTIVCQDESANTYPCQIDELSTRTGMPGATDTPGWLHSTISLLYTPSWTSGSNHTFHIYKQSGTYSPGTGLPTSALTGAHHYQVLYNNVKDFSNNTVGSGNFTCDLNNAIAAGARVGVGGGVASGGGGYTITENGQIETTIEALAPAIDNSGGTPQGQVMCMFYAMLWQTSPGSGTLGNVELAAWIGEPWQHQGSTIGFMWGDASVFDAATSTTLRNFSVQSSYAPSDFFPDPQTWPAGSAPTVYSAQCGNVACVGNGWGTGGAGNLTASNTTVTNSNAPFFPTSTVSGNTYLYVGSGNTGCTQGAYQITGTVTNGATLASAPCGSSGTISNWQLLSGFINNNGNLQTGTIVQFSATGGGTLPLGISATRPYFVGELAGSSNAPGPFAIGNVASMNQWPDFNGFASQGSCSSGSCIVATRKVGMQPWEGTWLFADDSGHPFWIGGNANGASLYPTPTNAQKNYWFSTALIPPYFLTGPATALSPYPLPGGSGQQASGPYYESLSAGPQEINIDGGGPHMSLGNMGGLEANAVLNMTQANWDLVHTHALTMASAFGHTVLNSATGWYTPYDCGPYPNGNLSSCGTYGTPIGAAGGHTADFLLWVNPGNSAQYSGFTTPAAVTGLQTTASQNNFDSGIFWAGGTDGSNTSMSHEPDYGNALAYIVGGEPWYLRGVQGWATFAMVSQWNQGNGVKSNTFTINGYTYSGSVLITNSTETPRGNAWSFRALMFASVLGADNDPGRALFWNYARESVDEAYAVIHQFYGQNINSCSGCSSDPNIETLGIISPLTFNSDAFMVSYYAGVTAQFYGLTHYSSNTLSGSSALWLANEAGTLSKNTWYDVPITNGTSGYTVCTYWAAAETYNERPNQYGGGVPETPGTLPAAANAGGISLAGDGSVGWRSAHMDSSGTVTPGTYNQTEQGLVENGDVIIPEFVAINNSALGSGPYWTVNVVSNSSTASFQLTTTPPSTQACSATTGSTGCPAAISPPSGVPFGIDLAWRPQACSPSSSTPPADGGGVDGYSAEDWAQFNLGIYYGLTLPNLSSALTNLITRWNMPGFPANNFAGNWQSWYMANQSAPPSQTIASISASPSTGSCATGATGGTCTTVSATMSPTSPSFGSDGGTFSLVASGGSCSGGDTTDFAINSTSGVITLNNASAVVQTDTVCVKAQTTTSNVTNSPQYQSVSINVTASGGGGFAIQNHGVCTEDYGNVNVQTSSCTLTISSQNDLVVVASGGCDGQSCGGSPTQPVLSSINYSAGTGGSGGSCTLATGTQVTAAWFVGSEIWYCQGMKTSGSVPFMFTWNANSSGGYANFPRMHWLDVAGMATTGADEGIGNKATGTTTASTLFTLTTNGNMTASQDLVVGMCISDGGAVLTAQQTALDAATGNIASLDEWINPRPSSSGVTASVGCTPSLGGDAYSISVAAFKHS